MFVCDCVCEYECVRVCMCFRYLDCVSIRAHEVQFTSQAIASNTLGNKAAETKNL